MERTCYYHSRIIFKLWKGNNDTYRTIAKSSNTVISIASDLSQMYLQNYKIVVL